MAAMNRVLRVVCRPAIADGFALAGVRALAAADALEAARVIDALLETPEVGVVLVDQALHDELPEERRRALEARALPVVVPFPGPRREEGPPPESELLELLRRAIGYRVRLR